MNRYGRLAREYWQRYLPDRYHQIEDPETFFTDLGIQVQEQVQTTEEQLLQPDPPGETYLQKVGRLNAIRAQAEEMVLADLVYLPSEEPQEDLEDPETEPSLLQQWQAIEQQARTDLQDY